ncbi:MAG: tetratricopeptide repeat protein [Planctomycetota bacterium]
MRHFLSASPTRFARGGGAVLAVCIFGWVAVGEELPSTGDAAIPYSDTRELEIPFSAVETGAAPVAAHQLWYTINGGANWQRAPSEHTGASPISFVAPADGHYGFLVTARDRARRETAPPQPGTVPDVQIIVDTTSPSLEVRDPVAGTSVYGGSDVRIRFECDDANLGERPVTVEWRRSGDEPWRAILTQGPFARTASPIQWFCPLAAGELELRITVVDLAHNVTTWTTPTPIHVLPFDGFRGGLSITAQPVSAFRRFPVYYRSATFSPIELREVEIWMRPGVAAWERLTDPDVTSPYIFAAPGDGRYFFYLRLIDLNGNADRAEPTPDTPFDLQVVVDAHSPEGTLIVGAGGEKLAHAAGAGLDITWESQDRNLAPGGCDLEVSLDGGETWKSLATGLSAPEGRGAFSWRPPLIEADSLRLRLKLRDLADNRSIIDCATRVQLVNPHVDPKQVAEERYQRALVLARSSGDPRDMAQRKQLLAALESLEMAVLYDAEHSAAWHDRGVILSMLGRHQEALTCYEQAYQLAPAHAPFVLDLASAHLNLHYSGAGDRREHLHRAEESLARVSREQIYKQPPGEFRELLRRFTQLKNEVHDQLAER